MVVRGAPAIGVTAAYAVVLSAQQHSRHSPDNWRELLDADVAVLAAARPTAVNLAWALQRMQARTDHYMPPSLLDSQLATLEPPGDDEPVTRYDVTSSSVAEITRQALEHLLK